jgi:hypothetical protein
VDRYIGDIDIIQEFYGIYIMIDIIVIIEDRIHTEIDSDFIHQSFLFILKFDYIIIQFIYDDSGNIHEIMDDINRIREIIIFEYFINLMEENHDILKYKILDLIIHGMRIIEKYLKMMMIIVGKIG